MFKATITFHPGTEAQEFTIVRTADNPWRLLTEDSAIKMLPVCDDRGRKVASPPPCEKLSVGPIVWDRSSWKDESHSLPRNKLREDSLDGLALYIGTTGVLGENCIHESEMSRIHFFADFYCGDTVQTIYLESCLPDEQTPEEIRVTPAYREEERRAQDRAKEPVSPTEVMHALGRGSIGSAKKRCKELGVPFPETRGDLTIVLEKSRLRKKSWKEHVRTANKKRKDARQVPKPDPPQASASRPDADSWWEERHGS